MEPRPSFRRGVRDFSCSAESQTELRRFAELIPAVVRRATPDGRWDFHSDLRHERMERTPPAEA